MVEDRFLRSQELSDNACVVSKCGRLGVVRMSLPLLLYII